MCEIIIICVKNISFGCFFQGFPYCGRSLSRETTAGFSAYKISPSFKFTKPGKGVS